MKEIPIETILQSFFDRFNDPLQSYFTKSATVSRNLVRPKKGMTFDQWVAIQTPRSIFLMVLMHQYRTPIAMCSDLYHHATDGFDTMYKFATAEYNFTKQFCQKVFMFFETFKDFRGVLPA